MTDLPLLPRIDEKEPGMLHNARLITLVGANGAGKTRFMKEMIRRTGDKAFYLSALAASFPEREPSRLPGSLDMLYRNSTALRPYMRSDAVSELDKLAYMLLTDEFDLLLDLKARTLAGEEAPEVKPSKLDTVIKVWQKIFPGSTILRDAGRLMFSNNSGDDPVTTVTLSQGEKAVFYYVAAVLYAMKGAVIFIDSPTLFIHPAILNTLWNTIEALRPDCTFVYNTIDPDFVNSRTRNRCVWIRSFDAAKQAWDYRVMDYSGITDDLFVSIIGSRRPVLFIEGDRDHSIDARLYTLVFSDFTVRPLGSCDKVIETTRTFNDQRPMHYLESRGIVDRDRRTEAEVGYLRRKNIFVPNVAEVENIFLLEDVVRIMALARGRNPERVATQVKNDVIHLFTKMYDRQVMEHVRHQVKRMVECKIDGRFTCITAMEAHLRNLVDKLNPRELYNRLREKFQAMIDKRDYEGILRVFNFKPMLAESPVSQLLGYKCKDDYIAGVLSYLKGSDQVAEQLRQAIKHCFGLDTPESLTEPAPVPEKSVRRNAPIAPHAASGPVQNGGQTASKTGNSPFPKTKKRRNRNKKRRRNRNLSDSDC